MKSIIHVNQHVIKANRKNQSNDPCLTVKTYKDNRYAHRAIIRNSQGDEVGRFIYSPNKPLSCGAHVWFETNLDVEIETD